MVTYSKKKIKEEATRFCVSFIKAKKLKINNIEGTTAISFLKEIIEIQARQFLSIFFCLQALNA